MENLSSTPTTHTYVLVLHKMFTYTWKINKAAQPSICFFESLDTQLLHANTGSMRSVCLLGSPTPEGLNQSCRLGVFRTILHTGLWVVGREPVHLWAGEWCSGL